VTATSESAARVTLMISDKQSNARTSNSSRIIAVSAALTG